MVIYTCDRCKKQFNQKCNYNDHVNRKILCDIVIENKECDNDEFYCNICNKYFSRSDALKRHLKSQLHKKNKSTQINNNSTKTNNGIINQIIGDKNVVINNKNYYFISPFGQEEIDDLTTEEKFAIFLSDDNPIIMIIVKTNLSQQKIQYHNIGYTNLNSGYGFIFNGESWEKKEIDSIMNDLLNSKRKDLLRIYTEIKDFLSENDSKNIENKLDNVGNNIEPKLIHHVKSKKKLVMNLKTHFYNNRTLVLDAIKNSGKPIVENNSKSNDKNNKSWNERYNIDDIDKKIKFKKFEANRINLKKEFANKIMTMLEDIDYESLKNVVDQTNSHHEIDIINRLLIKSFLMNDTIDKKIIKDKIQEDHFINKLLFG